MANPHRAEIVRLRQEGVGPREIARRLQISPSSVNGVLVRAKLTNGVIGGGGRGCGFPDAARFAALAYAAKHGKAAAARAFGISRRTILTWAKAA